MPTVDLSLPLTEGMAGFPGYPGFQARQLERHDVEGKVSHHLSLPTHQGTHVDAPEHFVERGATVDDLDLDLLWGEARVVDLRAHAGAELDAAVLEAAAPDLDADRVLLLTGDVDAHFGGGDFFEEAAVLTASAADWLLDRGVGLVANDFLTESIDVPMRPVHERLLGAGVPIVEYLCNADAVAGYETVDFACLPLALSGLEAAPARAVARFET
ncbi:MAG: cyclase family protein [Haloarculaceae archaeon]